MKGKLPEADPPEHQKLLEPHLILQLSLDAGATMFTEEIGSAMSAEDWTRLLQHWERNCNRFRWTIGVLDLPSLFGSQKCYTLKRLSYVDSKRSSPVVLKSTRTPLVQMLKENKLKRKTPPLEYQEMDEPPMILNEIDHGQSHLQSPPPASPPLSPPKKKAKRSSALTTTMNKLKQKVKRVKQPSVGRSQEVNTASPY